MNADMERAVERLVQDAVKQGLPEKCSDPSVLAVIAAAINEKDSTSLAVAVESFADKKEGSRGTGTPRPG